MIITNHELIYCIYLSDVFLNFNFLRKTCIIFKISCNFILNWNKFFYWVIFRKKNFKTIKKIYFFSFRINKLYAINIFKIKACRNNKTSRILVLRINIPYFINFNINFWKKYTTVTYNFKTK